MPGKRVAVLTGSYIDGPSEDLAGWVGLGLSDDDADRLASIVDSRRLLQECSSAEVEVTEEVDDAPPGLNDTYYTVWTDDVQGLKAELRALIVKKLRAAVRRSKKS
jgi:hypothetical protein